MTAKGSEATRLKLMDEKAEVVGRQWAIDWKREIADEGRPIAGGWPGTISQARARVYAYIHPILRDRGLRLPSTTENEKTARTLYRHARENWLNGGSA